MAVHHIQLLPPLHRKGIGAIWLAIIGWFLIQAAGNSLAARRSQSALTGLKVSDAMSRDCVTVPSNISLQDFVDMYLLRTGERCFVVQDQGYLVGMITTTMCAKSHVRIGREPASESP